MEIPKNLKWRSTNKERIDLVRGTVTLCEKGGKWRTVEYDKRYQDFMEKLVRENPEGPIFRGLRQSTVYWWIKKISRENGFEGRGLHSMRKNFAVQRHTEYTQRINELIDKKHWRTLAEEFPVSIQKAQSMCRKSYNETIDKLARLKLTKDLGHNRVEVTYRYVPKENIKC